MEWLIVEGPAVAIAVVTWLLCRKWKAPAWPDEMAAPAIVIAAAISCMCFVAAIAAPANYYATKNHALRAEAYYNEVALPNAVRETDTYITVSSTRAAIWQAGNMNAPRYNNYLKTTRYWNGIPFIDLFIYDPPQYLKFVRPLNG